jgi:hypothetical protein
MWNQFFCYLSWVELIQYVIPHLRWLGYLAFVNQLKAVVYICHNVGKQHMISSPLKATNTRDQLMALSVYEWQLPTTLPIFLQWKLFQHHVLLLFVSFSKSTTYTCNWIYCHPWIAIPYPHSVVTIVYRCYIFILEEQNSLQAAEQ